MAARVAITGAYGQLGYICRARLLHHHGLDVVPVSRAEFGDAARLAALIGGCDAVLHLAGVNRASPEEVRAQNPALAQRVVDACRAAGTAPAIVYSSTVKIDGADEYAEGKREAGRILEDFCRESGGRFVSVVLPNLFGEFSRPGYNNFTGTFCHQVFRGEAPSVHDDSPVALMSYTDAADALAAALLSDAGGETRPRGTETSVGTVAEKLKRYAALYAKGEIPAVDTPFDLSLFNAYRSVIEPRAGRLTDHRDARGSFFECIRAHGMGQSSFSTTVPGITRGDHFHFFKVERFIVISGTGRISLRRVFDGRVHAFTLSGDAPSYVDMPTLYTHKIENVGDTPLLTMFWTNDHFDPENADTYMEAVA